MKVGELLEKLSKLDRTMEIVCYCEDEKLLSEGRQFVLFGILGVDMTDAEQVRLEDKTPYLKFGKSPNASPIATLDISMQF